MKNKLHVAYPNTFLNGGIDEFGVYQNDGPWMRIAVSPFQPYKDPQEYEKRMKQCSHYEKKTTYWTCLTKEWWNSRKWRQDVIKKARKQGVIPANAPNLEIDHIYPNRLPPRKGGPKSS